MAQIRKTTYICDSCDKEVPKKKDLRKFSVHEHAPGGGWRGAAATDLCEECEPKFTAAVEEFFNEENALAVKAMVRG